METEGKFFDDVVAEEGDFDPLSPSGWESLRNAFQTHIQVRPDSVLDVGCGTGHSRQLYADVDDTFFVGADLSQRALSLARQRFPTSSWVTADGNLLPFKDNSFELVAFSSVLHHSSNPKTLLDAAFRVLTPGGVVFAFDPSLRNPAMALFRHPRSPLYRPQGVSPNERPLRSAPLRRMFDQAGFQDIRQVSKGGVSYKRVAPPLLNRGVGLYNAFDRLLAASGFDRWIGPFVITSARKGSGSSLEPV